MEASALLGQVGDIVEYTIHAEVAEPSSKLVVTVLVPPEMDVASVPLDDAADAIQAGLHGDQEDIVWVLGSVTPGNPVELHWFARVTLAGDLQATAVAEARTTAGRAQDETDTFLAAPPQVATQGSQPARVLGKVIHRVPIAPGSVLPVTGWSPAGMLWLAFACLALGSLLLVIGLTGYRRTTALVLLLGLSASCTPAPNEAGAPHEETHAAPQAEKDAAPRDRVLGIRIHNPPAPSETDEAPVEASQPSSPDAGATTTYRRVITEVQADLDLVTQDDREGDNTLSFAWAEPERQVATATSGLLLAAEQPSSLTAGLSWDTDGLLSLVRLQNMSSKPLRVQGELILEITGSGGARSTLSSGPVDIILAPQGLVLVSNRYLLPSGEYTLTSSFRH